MIKGGDGKPWERKGNIGVTDVADARATIYLESVRIALDVGTGGPICLGSEAAAGGTPRKTRYIRYISRFPKKVAKKAATNPLHFLGALDGRGGDKAPRMC